MDNSFTKFKDLNSTQIREVNLTKLKESETKISNQNTSGGGKLKGIERLIKELGFSKKSKTINKNNERGESKGKKK